MRFILLRLIFSFFVSAFCFLKVAYSYPPHPSLQWLDLKLTDTTGRYYLSIPKVGFSQQDFGMLRSWYHSFYVLDRYQKIVPQGKDTYLSIGIGASTYNFLDLYLFSVECLPGLGQNVFLGFAFDVYGKIKKEDRVLRPYAAFSVSGAYCISFGKVNFLAGPGVSFYFYDIAPILSIKVNYKAWNNSEIGFEIKSIFIRTKYIASDLYPIL